MRCIIIDDEPLARELLEDNIRHVSRLHLVVSCRNAAEAMQIMQDQAIDLVFCDIKMPAINGLQFVSNMQQKPMVIFTTAYKKFAFEGFELEALDYLLKPIALERFSAAVNKAVDFARYKNSEKNGGDESIYVHSEYRMIKINIKDIEYIESMQDYIKIHLTGIEKPILTLLPMKNVLERLPAGQFERIHRSYIVAVKHIQSIYNRKIQLKNIELPVGNNFADFIKNWTR